MHVVRSLLDAQWAALGNFPWQGKQAPLQSHSPEVE